jgi:predicted esterase
LSYVIFSNIGTISAKLLLQLASALRPGGLCNRTGTVAYKDQLHKSITPVLAVAGDEDFICPPEAVLGKTCIKLECV